jgi:hypothetical protein
MRKDCFAVCISGALAAALLLVGALTRAAQPRPTSTPEPNVVFGSVRVRPGVPFHISEPLLKQTYVLEFGMPDLQLGRFPVILRPKVHPEQFPAAATKGPTLKLPLGIAGTVVLNATGEVTRVWKNWGDSRDEAARALAYTLVAATKNLISEGNTQATISVTQSRTDNTTLKLDFGSKTLHLIIYDSPGGAMSVSVVEGVSAD